MTHKAEANNTPKILSNDLDQTPKTGPAYQDRLDDMKHEIKAAFDKGTIKEVDHAFAQREKVPFSPLTKKEAKDGYCNIRFDPQMYITWVSDILNEDDEHRATAESLGIYHIDNVPVGAPVTYASSDVGGDEPKDRWIYLGKGKFIYTDGMMSPQLRKKIGHLINTSEKSIDVWTKDKAAHTLSEALPEIQG